MKKTGAKPKGPQGTDKFLLLDHGDFRHYGDVDQESHIIFQEDGTVTVQWNRTAAIASAYGAGNRRVRATVATGKRTPPVLHPLFDQIELCQSFANFREAIGDPVPIEPFDERVPKLLESTFRDIAWKMISAVLQGDADSLHDIAETVALVETVKKFTDIKWSKLAEAIRIAAVKANGPPYRNDVEDEYRNLVPRNLAGNESYREDLGRMGFNWLPRRTGRPPKVG